MKLFSGVHRQVELCFDISPALLCCRQAWGFTPHLTQSRTQPLSMAPAPCSSTAIRLPTGYLAFPPELVSSPPSNRQRLLAGSPWAMGGGAVMGKSKGGVFPAVQTWICCALLRVQELPVAAGCYAEPGFPIHPLPCRKAFLTKHINRCIGNASCVLFWVC